MRVQLTKPEVQRFINEKVKTGHFPSAEAVVEDAITRMMEEEPLAADDLAAIQESDRQIELGESVEFAAFDAKVRKRFNVG